MKHRYRSTTLTVLLLINHIFLAASVGALVTLTVWDRLKHHETDTQ